MAVTAKRGLGATSYDPHGLNLLRVTENLRLPLRCGDVLGTLEREWASEKPQIRFKYLAMLQLWSHGGWTLEQIGHVFNHPKGHVTRIINNTIADLRERFEADWASFVPEDD